MSSSKVHALAVQVAISNASNTIFDTKNSPEFDVDDVGYRVISIRKDIDVRSSGGGPGKQASRVQIDCVPTSKEPTARPDIQAQTYHISAHVFTTGFGGLGGADGESQVIMDTDSLRKAVEPQSVKTSFPVDAHKMEVRGSSHTDTSETLSQKYQAYICAINERNMTHTLPTFCHDVIVHNGKALPLPEYQQLMAGAQAVIADLEFSVANLVVDAEKQIVAAKLDFRGSPTGEFAGVTPPEGARKEVRFSEIVFYWFKGGKIAQVVSLVDLDTYREQVAVRRRSLI